MFFSSFVYTVYSEVKNWQRQDCEGTLYKLQHLTFNIYSLKVHHSSLTEVVLKAVYLAEK